MNLSTLLLLSTILLTGPSDTHKEIAGERMVMISTVFGDMTIKLYDDTPLHRDNFIRNVEAGYYNNTLFHRVIPYFMMQGGDPNSIGADPDQMLGTDSCPTIPAEIIPGRFHKKGALAAARVPDQTNPQRVSSGCQFFIVQGYKHSDAQLVGSGKILTAMQKAIIDLVCAMETHKTGGIKDRPIEDIKMTVRMLN